MRLLRYTPATAAIALALIMQEALASGLVVLGSATGGTKEIIREGENGFLFEAGDAAGLAAHIEQLAADPDLCRRVGARGQETARRRFALGRMVDDLDAYLAGVASGASTSVPARASFRKVSTEAE